MPARRLLRTALPSLALLVVLSTLMRKESGVARVLYSSITGVKVDATPRLGASG